jgi:hypothetical protein
MEAPVSTTQNALTTLTGFGSRDELREMTDRILSMMPGTVRLTKDEARTVAQIAVAHGLDPFNGEVWPLKGENDKWYGVMIGIKGLRKAARRQADQENTVYWTEVTRVDPKTYAQAETAVVYETRLRDTMTMQAYGKSLNILTTAGIPYAEAIRMVGSAPVKIGVGIATPDERSKMGLHARAKKRSEADAIKQRFDVNFLGADYTEGTDETPADAILIEAEHSDTPAAQVVKIEDQPKKSEQEMLAGLGY